MDTIEFETNKLIVEKGSTARQLETPDLLNLINHCPRTTEKQTNCSISTNLMS